MKYISILVFLISCTDSVTVNEISGNYVMNDSDATNLYVIKKDGSYQHYHWSMLKVKTMGTYTISGNKVTLKDKESTSMFDIKKNNEVTELIFDRRKNRLIFPELNGMLYLEKFNDFQDGQKTIIDYLDSMEINTNNSY